MTLSMGREMDDLTGAKEAFDEIEKELTSAWDALHGRMVSTLTSKIHSKLYSKIFSLYMRNPEKTMSIFYSTDGVIVRWLYDLVRCELNNINVDKGDIVYQYANIFTSFQTLLKAVCLIFTCCEPKYKNATQDFYSSNVSYQRRDSMRALLLHSFHHGPINSKKGTIVQLICNELDRARDGNEVKMEKLKIIFDILGSDLVNAGETGWMDYTRDKEIAEMYKVDVIDPYLRSSIKYYQEKVHDTFTGGAHSIDMVSYPTKALEWLNEEIKWAKNFLKTNRITYLRNHPTPEQEIRVALTRVLVYDKLEAVINSPGLLYGVTTILSNYPDDAARSHLRSLFAFVKESANVTTVSDERNFSAAKGTEGMDMFCEGILSFVSDTFGRIIEDYKKSFGPRPTPEFNLIQECSNKWESLLMAIGDCDHLGRIHEAVKTKVSAILKGNITRTINKEDTGKGTNSIPPNLKISTEFSIPFELSVYFDYLMRKKSDNHEQLIVLSHLLPIIEEKDKFTNAFMKFFKARILEGATNIAEEIHLKKYLTAYNTTLFTENPSCEATFTDCVRCESIANDIQGNINSNVSVSFSVYRKGLWIDLIPIPMYSIRPSVTVFPVIQDQLRILEDIYKTKYKNQSLEWSWVNSSVTVEISRSVEGSVGLQCKELIFSNLLSASAFLYLNEAGTEGLTLSDILSKMNMGDTDKEGVMCLFHFMMKSSLELRVISPKESSKSISSSTSFVVNPAFIDENKQSSVQIYTPQTEREKRTAVDIEAEVTPLRQKRIQAIIVRLMKNHHEMYFDDIVDRTMNALDIFKSNRKDIKTQIELLIDQGIIKRSRDECNKFEYLA